jgi:hypothetical protein
MNQQQIIAYVELIARLWTCRSGEEQGILAQHQNLLDVDLLNALPGVFELFRSSELTPADIGNLFGNFGNQLQGFPHGNRSINLEIEIESYKLALQVYICVDYPEDFAETQNNLGIAYSDRIKGDKHDNLELAIESYKLAMKVFTGEDYPEQWAITQNNLGTAYSDRIKGDKHDNLKLAIESYKLALVFTGEDYPEQWAMTQNNLGAAYRERFRGNKHDNLELAIELCKLALKVFTRKDYPEQWAMTQNNLGAAYSDRLHGDKRDNLELEIESYKLALQVYTHEDYPEQWAMTQNNLGAAYSDKLNDDRRDNLELAIESYELSLQVCTPTTFPTDCLETATSLGKCLFNQGWWQQAIEAYSLAATALENIRSQSNEDRQQNILSSNIHIYENLLQAAINHNQLPLALETVERVRSKRLVELMATPDLYKDGKIPAPVKALLDKLDSIQRQIDKLRPDNGGSNREQKQAAVRSRAQLAAISDDIAALEAEKARTRAQLAKLDPVAAGLTQVAPLPLAELQSLIPDPRTALLSFYTTTKHTHIFILRHNTAPECFICPGEGRANLQEWLQTNWLAEYSTNNQQWRANMPEILAELSQRLQIDAPLHAPRRLTPRQRRLLRHQISN